MPTRAPDPTVNLVNFEQLKNDGTRTVEVTVRGNLVRVTEKLEDDSSVDKEIGRARFNAQRGTRAAQALMAISGENPEEKKAREAELARATEAMDSLDVAVTFDRRRIVCRRISTKFLEWNIVGADGQTLPLDFDGLYDGPLGTPVLEEIYQTVQDEPFVPETNA